MKLFALDSSRDFGELVAKELGTTLNLHEEISFEDGEHKCRPLESVRNQDVFVIQSLYSDSAKSVNDKLCRLLFFISALKDASAAQVTAIVPYLCYARKDRKSKPRDPVTTRYVAQLFEASGTDQVVTIDVHNLQAFNNAFRIPTINLEANSLFADCLIRDIADDELVIMSPDIGGVKRAEQFQRLLGKRLNKELPLAFMEKYRSSGEVWGETIIGNVEGRTVIVIDDMVSTGGTLGRAATACKNAGANKVLAVATHGLFTGKPEENLKESCLQKIFVTNTIPPFRLGTTNIINKVLVINVAPLFAKVITRLFEGGSVTDLMQE
ncbi:ribose-phosphate diphosphokinase [Flavihumibacter profundi]|jgi:ribose-phosphate pyrophosphokinase|uniref:ribose-phosphate diphosphokinase n=1 Tax=Flavihumibacter profundi TaxID=2716883 RepID=UPI001CC4EC31|nr:ribose-phosphate pyrophosphokinase [Flavihumibacter profundi]MBZ5856326.1 ribose-phosphate pyrophosphokinase [Flavihumibacter profundi]